MGSERAGLSTSEPLGPQFPLGVTTPDVHAHGSSTGRKETRAAGPPGFCAAGEPAGTWHQPPGQSARGSQQSPGQRLDGRPRRTAGIRVGVSRELAPLTVSAGPMPQCSARGVGDSIEGTGLGTALWDSPSPQGTAVFLFSCYETKATEGPDPPSLDQSGVHRLLSRPLLSVSFLR